MRKTTVKREMNRAIPLTIGSVKSRIAKRDGSTMGWGTLFSAQMNPAAARTLTPDRERILKERTSLVIAHRLSTIRNVDRIVVLHHGCVREMGSHSELLKKGGLYKRLYELEYRNQN